jgi:hypothetical protein
LWLPFFFCCSYVSWSSSLFFGRRMPDLVSSLMEWNLFRWVFLTPIDF